MATPFGLSSSSVLVPQPQSVSSTPDEIKANKPKTLSRYSNLSMSTSEASPAKVATVTTPLFSSSQDYLNQIAAVQSTEGYRLDLRKMATQKDTRGVAAQQLLENQLATEASKDFEEPVTEAMFIEAYAGNSVPDVTTSLQTATSEAANLAYSAWGIPHIPFVPPLRDN